MKTKLSILLTALLLLFCFNVNAQEVVVGDGDKIVTGNRSNIVNAILDGSDETTFDVNTDQEVNIADVVELNNMVTVNLQFNNTGSQTIRLAPRFRFVLSSGETEAAWFAPIWSPLVLSPGETTTIENVKMPKTRHLLGKTFAEDGDGYDSNVVLYDESFNSTTFVPEMISSSTKFKEGNTYKIYVSSSTNTPIDDNPQGGNSDNPQGGNSDNPQGGNSDNPQGGNSDNPQGGNSDNPTNQDNPSSGSSTPTLGQEIQITIGLKLINASGRTVTLDPKLNFVLGNPDKNGYYHGTWPDGSVYTAQYNREESSFGGYITLGAGESRIVYVSGNLGGRSPLDPGLLGIAGRNSNIMLYIGNISEAVTCDNMDPNIVFQNGQTYNVVITSVNSGSSDSGSSGSGSSTPTLGQEITITIGLNLKNESGRTVTLDPKLNFVLGNPDKNGYYHGRWDDGSIYTLAYNREQSSFGSYITLGAGESRLVYVSGPLGGRSPLDPSLLYIAERLSNILLYIGNNSEVVICENMNPNIVFQNGGIYNVVFH